MASNASVVVNAIPWKRTNGRSSRQCAVAGLASLASTIEAQSMSLEVSTEFLECAVVKNMIQPLGITLNKLTILINKI